MHIEWWLVGYVSVVILAVFIGYAWGYRDREGDFKTDDLVLSVLAQHPLHGYGIYKDIAGMTSGKVKVSAATLYESLARLEKAGLISRGGEAMVDGRRRMLWTARPKAT